MPPKTSKSKKSLRKKKTLKSIDTTTDEQKDESSAEVVVDNSLDPPTQPEPQQQQQPLTEQPPTGSTSAEEPQPPSIDRQENLEDESVPDVIVQPTASASILQEYSDDSKKPKKSRLILINYNQREKFASNHVKTSKYTIYSFLPIFIYEQFRRYSNIFFLCIAILQQIPDVSPTGRWTTAGPFTIILLVSALKEAVEDYKRHKADENTNNRKVEVLRQEEFRYIKWQEICVGEFVRIEQDQFVPADIVLYSSSEPLGMCYIETSNLDGETNLKVRQALAQTTKLIEKQDFLSARGFIECGVPNRQVYEFTGSIQLESEGNILPLGPDQLLLRGAKLRNTSWIYGQVVYTGHETKLMKNSTKPPLKRSTLDIATNQQIIMLFILLIFISFLSAAFSIFLTNRSDIQVYIGPSSSGKGSVGLVTDFFYQFLTFIILYNNLIPISLTVTLEVVRFVQALFINWDQDMYHLESDTPATARTSNLNEELGQIRYIFSDKTGTLTRNEMEFKGCSVGGILYPPDTLFPEEEEGEQKISQLITNLQDRKGTESSVIIWEFLVLLAVCHNVIPESKTLEDGSQEIVYNASSPDEQALVLGAKAFGFEFLRRTPNSVDISALGDLQRYEILNIIEFTSFRKRMSVIVKCPDGKIRLYCKGADSVIYERLSNDGKEADGLNLQTQNHLQVFASEGLRTLCCATKILSEEEFKKWNIKFQKAANQITDRSEAINEIAELMEKNLILLGATAIEDKLQDYVPETIAAFLEAKISVWVLTGDKQETAINIGNSCKLITPSTMLLIINQETDDNTHDCIQAYAKELSVSLDSFKDKKALEKIITKDAAVIDGKTLPFALSEKNRHNFLCLCCSCKAVIVCRAAPMQKAEIVEAVTKLTGAITLAIGDGANDVAMIQKAHVGIGISGKEGLQAACASDYAIGQFYYLKKLLFVHGAWNHDRITKTVFYSFYKNICLYIIELWFAIYSAWSGQVIFERWTIGCYNMIFTCLQPICIGIFDRNCSMTLRLNNPSLYHSTSSGAFTLTKFFIWVGNSLLHSICLFWFTLFLLGSGIIWGNGTEGSYLVLGNCIYTYVVIVVSLKAGLVTRAWTKYTLISIWGSILMWFIFLIVYSFMWTWTSIGVEIYGLAEQVFLSIIFWIGLIVVPLATLIPDILYKALQGSNFQSEPDIFREEEIVDQKNRKKRISHA